MILKFGKFKGQELTNTPSWYQNWLNKQDWFNTVKTTVNLTIDLQDLQILFVKTRFAYKNYTFDMWVKECKESYLDYYDKKPLELLSFSQWVNRQIIYLN